MTPSSLTIKSAWIIERFYRASFSGAKRAARPTVSLLWISFSGFGFLNSDGRFRIWTSFLNCWHRAFCWQGTGRGEVKQSNPRHTTRNFIWFFSTVELLHIFCRCTQRIYSTARNPLLSNDLHYRASVSPLLKSGLQWDTQVKHCSLVVKSSLIGICYVGEAP